MSLCHDRFIQKNIFTSYVGLCQCIVDPHFSLAFCKSILPGLRLDQWLLQSWWASVFDYLVNIWATCENFLGKWFTAPLAKNCLYAYDRPRLIHGSYTKSWTELSQFPKIIMKTKSNTGCVSTTDLAEHFSLEFLCKFRKMVVKRW